MEFSLVGLANDKYELMRYTANALRKAKINAFVKQMRDEVSEASDDAALAICQKYIDFANKKIKNIVVESKFPARKSEEYKIADHHQGSGDDDLIFEFTDFVKTYGKTHTLPGEAKSEEESNDIKKTILGEFAKTLEISPSSDTTAYYMDEIDDFEEDYLTEEVERGYSDSEVDRIVNAYPEGTNFEIEYLSILPLSAKAVKAGHSGYKITDVVAATGRYSARQSTQDKVANGYQLRGSLMPGKQAHNKYKNLYTTANSTLLRLYPDAAQPQIKIIYILDNKEVTLNDLEQSGFISPANIRHLRAAEMPREILEVKIDNIISLKEKDVSNFSDKFRLNIPELNINSTFTTPNEVLIYLRKLYNKYSIVDENLADRVLQPIILDFKSGNTAQYEI